ncbi:MAG: Lrp/AsnC family transcriptional regulator [Candidatus Aenigmarchaeota archaeon]|nr:Lrp/AsnC family transcriptional regulator [Candidatus Aenigmarchaeota archaeon]
MNTSIIKLDEKDKKILLELDTDAAQSLKKIAKKLRTTKEVISYRIKQLEEKGIITSYIGIYHMTKLGLTHYKMNIKFSHITEEKKKEIIDYLLKEKRFLWLALSEGEFDLMFAVHMPSIFEFERFKDQLFSKFDSYFQRSSFAIMTEAEAYPRQYILGTKNPARRPFLFCEPVERVPIDEDDWKIITALSMNGHASSNEIAKMTGLTERIVRYRKSLLEKKGLIVGYKLVIDYRKLGNMFFKCFIKLQNANEKHLHSLRMYARQHPNVVHWLRVLGEWDLELEIEVPSVDKFYEISNDLRNRFSGIIQTLNTVLVTEEHLTRHI